MDRQVYLQLETDSLEAEQIAWLVFLLLAHHMYLSVRQLPRENENNLRLIT